MFSIFGKKNMGPLDRVIRLIAGLVMMYLGFIDQAVIGNLTINIIVGVFGVIFIVSAYKSFCPFYTFANISTIKKSSNNG